MLPARSEVEALNTLIGTIGEFGQNRKNLGMLHEQRINGLVSKTPENSDERILAELIRSLFYRRFSEGKEWLERAKEISPADSVIQLNIANAMTEAFHPSQAFEYIRESLPHQKDSTKFLYGAFDILSRNGAFQLANSVAKSLEKLGAPLPEHHDRTNFLALKMEVFGISDEHVVNYLEKALAPIERHLDGKEHVHCMLTTEFTNYSHPETFVIVAHIAANDDEVFEISEAVAEYLAEFDFSKEVDEHLVFVVTGADEEYLKHAS